MRHPLLLYARRQKEEGEKEKAASQVNKCIGQVVTHDLSSLSTPRKSAAILAPSD